ncbi:hypothetical protein Cfor_05011 [Coptotermes formosanus]|jgi:hypothetical protein|uniref:PiggyBac transposable element-derived protein domain-containing protein n=1 Tax=Coptotermes formosanus TaxID=36987 RepID=A0A6L2PF67_COPFO|nr:hypothetical protein Cfor_05011 [Coptotermes formosanus]
MQNITTDENLMKFCGRLSFVKFNSINYACVSKEYYKSCKSSNGYCTQFGTYSGQKVGSEGLLLHKAAVVMELTAPYKSKH